jgi:hypothetical protein
LVLMSLYLSWTNSKWLNETPIIRPLTSTTNVIEIVKCNNNFIITDCSNFTLYSTQMITNGQDKTITWISSTQAITGTPVKKLSIITTDSLDKTTIILTSSRTTICVKEAKCNNNCLVHVTKVWDVFHLYLSTMTTNWLHKAPIILT